MGKKNIERSSLWLWTLDMVGVTGFEPAASTSQTSRATNCATPRCVIFIRFLVIFRKWSNLWSDHFFVLVLEKRMCEKVSIYKGFRAFEKSRSQNRLHAPKPGALPTALHPEKDWRNLVFHSNDVIIPQKKGKVNIFPRDPLDVFYSKKRQKNLKKVLTNEMGYDIIYKRWQMAG